MSHSQPFDRQTDSGKYEPQSNGLYHAVGETTAGDEPLVTTFETRDSRNLHISSVPHRAVHILGSSIIVKAMLTRRALKCRRECFRCVSDCRVPAMAARFVEAPISDPACRLDWRHPVVDLGTSSAVPQSQPVTTGLASPSGRPELFSIRASRTADSFEFRQRK
jgi:hypothetical protein